MADTIFAVSSGRPPAAIAVLRISGAGAIAAAATLAGSLPEPRRAALRSLRSGDALLDRALVLVFPGPDSATGEDLVELHCHGGRAVVAAVERALTAMPGLRPAEAGEFTRRALLHGRIDLAEVQGLADLLAAETEAQRRAAIGMAEGRLSRAVREWLDRLSIMAARVEASLDFAEESDVDDGAVLVGLHGDMASLAVDIDGALAAPAVDRLRDGIRVVLAGPPNSGKSTLLNRLVEREAAIVSPHAGTTRDRVEVGVARNGLPFLLTDTAGLRDTDDAVETIGILRARDAVTEADIVLWLGDDLPPRSDAIGLHARADLPGREGDRAGKITVQTDRPETIGAVWQAIEQRAALMTPREDQLALDARQRRHCAAAADLLHRGWSDPLVGAELIRRAQRELAALLGVDATEAMLDALFGRFCIGK